MLSVNWVLNSLQKEHISDNGDKAALRRVQTFSKGSFREAKKRVFKKGMTNLGGLFGIS